MRRGALAVGALDLLLDLAEGLLDRGEQGLHLDRALVELGGLGLVGLGQPLLGQVDERGVVALQGVGGQRLELLG